MYIINQEIPIVYQARYNKDNITDLILTVTDPNDNILSPISFTNLGEGFYKANFIPTIKGTWIAKTSSETFPYDSQINNFQVSEAFSEDGKAIVRAESRPLGYTTSFTSIGDSDINIGDGKELLWDFSNDDDLLSSSSGSSTKIKRIEFKFLDDIYLKEGAIYFQNALFGSYIDIKVVCPNGQYYLNNNGDPTLATEDTIIHQYLSHHFICGNCPMGDELNTEACSSKLPNYLKYWIDITVPISDDLSTGHISVELYRPRTVIL